MRVDRDGSVESLRQFPIPFRVREIGEPFDGPTVSRLERKGSFELRSSAARTRFCEPHLRQLCQAPRDHLRPQSGLFYLPASTVHRRERGRLMAGGVEPMRAAQLSFESAR